jgi:hypothetical protein
MGDSSAEIGIGKCAGAGIIPQAGPGNHTAFLPESPPKLQNAPDDFPQNRLFY